jgi:restriction endonuclease S subunit
MIEWQRARLEEVIALDVEPVPIVGSTSYDIVGVLNRGRGLLYRDALFGDKTSYKTLNRVRGNQIIYSRLKAFEGAITVAPRDLGEAYASQEFPTFACGDRVLPEYFRLLTTTKRVWEQLQALSTGMGGRRERVKPSDFLTIEIMIPPLHVQRRIVDVLSGVDAHIDALSSEFDRGRASLGPMVGDLLAGGSEQWKALPLSAVGAFTRGRRFTKKDYVASGLGCIHYGQLHTEFGLITTSPITYIPEESRASMRLANPGDVVLAGTSENIEDLGNATVWLGDDDVAVHDDAYIFKHDLDPVFASCLFVSPEFQAQKVQYAAGTKVTRISGDNLGRIHLPIPPKDVQVAVGSAVKALDNQLRGLEHELTTVRSFRSALLTSLLNQEIEIPESYDRLLAEVS